MCHVGSLPVLSSKVKEKGKRKKKRWRRRYVLCSVPVLAGYHKVCKKADNALAHKQQQMLHHHHDTKEICHTDFFPFSNCFSLLA